jgi:hypothetical protein
MATTTNYAWETPDDTDLVKDGASAIRTLGSSIDTTTKALNPSTTLGDIEFRSATANTNTRLGIGTSGQYLTVSGGVPAWGDVSAGGMTLISTTSLSGTTTTISSIPQTYNSLFLIVSGVTTSAGNDEAFTCSPNNVNNLVDQTGVAAGSLSAFAGSQIQLSAGASTQRTNANNVWTLQIDNYTSTTRFKPFNLYGVSNADASSRTYVIQGGAYRSNTAITSLVFNYAASTMNGGTVLLYGVK